MSAAASPLPLLARLREVLLAGEGHAFIPAGHFRSTTGRTTLAKLPSSQAVSVAAIEITAEIGRWSDGERINPTAGSAVREIPIIITVGYAYGGGNARPAPDGQDRESICWRAAADAILIDEALSYPGNLATTSSGEDTGCVSGLLQHIESEARPEFLDDQGVAIVAHRYLARLNIGPQPAPSNT